MNFFPKKYYSIELQTNSSTAIEKLKNYTLSAEQFVSNWNNQVFIGRISNHKFEVKLSKKHYGQFCIAKGKLEKEKGILVLEISRLFKILFLLIFLFVLCGILTAIIQNKLYTLIPLICTLIILRFLLLELGFYIVSKILLKQLTKVIGIAKLISKLN